MSSHLSLTVLVLAVFACIAPALVQSSGGVSETRAHVVILGGGIGGMTTAHELALRGFSVDLYEGLAQLGGKARSFGAKGTGTDGRRDLPAEHGFRVFAGEYGATRDTMKRIPSADDPNKSVVDHMVDGDLGLVTAPNSTTFYVPSHFPDNKVQLKEWLEYFKTASAFLPNHESHYFLERVLIVMTSSMERRYAEFENVSWWEFMHADSYSVHYQDLVRIISGNILAANPLNANAHVVGYLAADLLCRTIIPFQKGILYMLDGPTSDVWIDPWEKVLVELGVNIHKQHVVKSIGFDVNNKVISGVVVQDETGKEVTVKGDYYVASLPAEKLSPLLTPDIINAAPSLQNIHKLKTAWMVGVQLYLKRNVDIVYGTVGFLRSPWALAGVSQDQFRPSLNLTQYGDGQVKGVLSLTVSNWTEPGQYVCKRPALSCTKEEIFGEVWAQVKAWLPDEGLTDDDLLGAYIDDNIVFGQNHNGGSSGAPSVPISNYSPLLINTPKSWYFRPQPTTEVANLLIAADFAQTPQNVACMETANQAARMAVNAILDSMQIPSSQASRLSLFPAEANGDAEGAILRAILKPFQEWDEKRFKEGKPHIGCKCPACTCPDQMDVGGSTANAVESEWESVQKQVVDVINDAYHFAEQLV